MAALTILMFRWSIFVVRMAIVREGTVFTTERTEKVQRHREEARREQVGLTGTKRAVASCESI